MQSKGIHFLLSALLVAMTASCSNNGELAATMSEPVIDGNIYDSHRDVVSQQFDIDSEGNLYYAQINAPSEPWSVCIFRIPRKKLSRGTASAGFRGDSLKLVYAGHPTGMAVQNCRDGKYVWIGNFASRTDGRNYWGTQAVCRVKFDSNLTLRPENLEYFWFPHTGDINVALDEKNDQVAFSFYYRGDDPNRVVLSENRRRMVRIYSLKEALSAPQEDIALSDFWIRGGDGAPDASLDTLPLTIRAHNLSYLKPIAEIGTHNGGDNPEKINATAWQGFDIDNGVVWFSEGGGRSGTFVTGYGYDGSIVFHRTPVAVSNPCQEWDKYCLASPYDEGGTFENEGVRVWNGNLYLGMFTIRVNDGKKERMSNVFRFPLPATEME